MRPTDGPDALRRLSATCSESTRARPKPGPSTQVAGPTALPPARTTNSAGIYPGTRNSRELETWGPAGAGSYAASPGSWQGSDGSSRPRRHPLPDRRPHDHSRSWAVRPTAHGARRRTRSSARRPRPWEPLRAGEDRVGARPLNQWREMGRRDLPRAGHHGPHEPSESGRLGLCRFLRASVRLPSPQGCRARLTARPGHRLDAVRRRRHLRGLGLWHRVRRPLARVVRHPHPG